MATMFQTRPLENGHIELIDTETPSRAVLAPQRGGMLTSLSVRGREALFLDQASFDDATRNVRGGNPVLFPSPGKLTGDRWAQGALKQHGFARNEPWSVGALSTEGAASATLTLESSAATRAGFPFDFSLAYTYSLAGGRLRLDLRVRNRSAEEMPFGAGFHPYFAVPQAEKAGARVATAATRAFDNVSKQDAPYRLDLSAPEVDLHLLDHGGASSALSWGDRRVVIEGSPEFSRWVIWTLAGKDFVCLEPWTCPGDALNTGASLIRLAPGATAHLWLTYTIEG
jgi:galactose mutarotase-like enzyme